MTSDLLSCYNKGCGQNFNPDKNTDDSCQYHPGGPIFHDALKGWSCCKKRVTDFTEFLNIKGCTTGKHTNVKPPEPVKKEKEKETMIQLEVTPQHRQPDPTPEERPSEDEEMVVLKTSIGASLTTQLKKLSLKEKEETIAQSDGSVKIGTPCHNKGCKFSYEGESSNQKICRYHPGVPIFHEGMKYWSCCQRKTSDFEAFLNQEGCTEGKCNWIKPKESEEKQVRTDWHQTSSCVCLAIFAKVAIPEKTVIRGNKVKLEVDIVYEGGKSMFKKTFILREAIDPTKTEVKLLGTKVEINMKKRSAFSWPSLELLQQD